MSLESLPLPQVTALWFGVVLVALASLIWARASSTLTARFPWVFWVALGATTLATLGATLLPMELPAGFVPPRATWDPLLGLRQILLLDANAWDVDVTQAWAVGNLVLLWPLAAVLLQKLSPVRVMLTLTVAILCIETTQGLVPALGRSFELSDLVSNLLGAVLLIWVTTPLRKQPYMHQKV